MKDKSSKTGKLPFRDKFIWCAQGFVASLPWVIVGYYLLYFYTDYMKISAALAGTIMAGAKIFDAITDMLIGGLVDNCHFKWGKFRTWVRFAIPANIILWPLMWVAVEGHMTLNIVLAVIAYGCMGAIGCTLYYIPTNCQLQVLTDDEGERASLVAWKGVAGSIASVVAVAVFMPMVNWFGGNSSSFLLSAIVLGIPYVGLLIADYVMSKKYELNPDGTWKEELELKDSSGEKPKISQQFKTLFSNKPAVIAVIGIFLMYVIQAFRSSAAVYVFNYYFEMPDMGTIALTAMTIAAVVGALVMNPVIKLLKDTNRAYILWTILLVVDSVIFYVLAKTMSFDAAQKSLSWGLLFWLFILGGFIQGAYYNFCYLELPMAVEYGTWKNGYNQSGFIYSLNGFTLTAGGAIGTALVGFALSAIGYEEGVELTASIKEGLLFVGMMAPALIGVAHAVVQLFFGINEKQYAQIKADLAEREAAAEEQHEAAEGTSEAEDAPAVEADATPVVETVEES